MSYYQSPTTTVWTGRASEKPLYWHQKIQLSDFTNLYQFEQLPTVGLLGYQCDEGVRRNHGRVGAVEGPSSIRKMLAALSDHSSPDQQLVDFGDIICQHRDLEKAHELIAHHVHRLLNAGVFPILLGGGHDLAYAHFKGIHSNLNSNQKIGIINLDAHFDLRKVENERTSGTPFFQILEEFSNVEYLCLGIQQPANNRELFDIAREKRVSYILSEEFNLNHWSHVQSTLESFCQGCDKIYLTIDLDGFSSAYAPGVSAPSPMGFAPDVVIKTIDWIKNANKLISADIVELNPTFDVDHATARLAARLVERLVTPAL